MAAGEPKLTLLGKVVVIAVVGACLYGAYALFARRTSLTPVPPGTQGEEPTLAGLGDSEIGLAYGTEKQRWLEWAAQEFQKTKAGKKTKVNLIPKGSLEGAQAILSQDKRIHIWSPASAVYKDVFVQDWQAKFGNNPILKEETLALSPMVFVFWKERYDAFKSKMGAVTFQTISAALAEKSGWQGIAGKPEWGFFKFGHTHPNQSNSGLVTLVLAAYSFHNKTRNMQLQDILDVNFQTWLQAMERGVSGLSNSTGNMMKEMVLKGPSSFDALFVYENVAIDYMKNAEGRWGQLQVIYPDKNMWNENPYYIIDAPWSSSEQRKAAAEFLNFLMSEPVQKEALSHGFRPGNPNVPIKFPGSLFETYAPFGIRVDVGAVCEPPRAEVVNNLLAGWQRSQGVR